MVDHFSIFKWSVLEARTNPKAESVLREIIRGAADAAPLDDLTTIGESLVEIYRSLLRKEAEAN